MGLDDILAFNFGILDLLLILIRQRQRPQLEESDLVPRLRQHLRLQIFFHCLLNDGPPGEEVVRCVLC